MAGVTAFDGLQGQGAETGILHLTIRTLVEHGRLELKQTTLPFCNV